eukprot:TRINITY_DN97703_c0_g1_i1.p2 TRINITY_DN97703_c0_g1~~TRINITY_DN97703_c0_g1_i1.p2  ORF type:complete len:171 (-),score=8.36 TRINITY_DN97703_c0_g1_i1:5-517(-)
MSLKRELAGLRKIVLQGLKKPCRYKKEKRKTTNIFTPPEQKFPAKSGIRRGFFMQSFRSEIENPIVQKDIIELANKIELFHNGKIDEEKFRSLRLARGVYGQRQEGVQMIRIKLPYGKVKSNQLHRICEVSDEYSRGRLQKIKQKKKKRRSEEPRLNSSHEFVSRMPSSA